VGKDIPEYNTDKYHVRVRLTKNPNNSFGLDLHWGGCAATTQICSGNTDTNWYTNFLNLANTQPKPSVPGPTVKGAGEQNCRPDADHLATPENYDDDTTPTSRQCTDNTQTFYFRVYRLPSKPATCDNYEVEVSNGMY
jgi:hypothetical protein